VKVEVVYRMVDHFKHRVLKAHHGAFIAVTYRMQVLRGPAVKPAAQVNRALTVADRQAGNWTTADSVSGCSTATLAFAADRTVPHYPGKEITRGRAATTVAVYLVPKPDQKLAWVDRVTGARASLPTAHRLNGTIA
jgi:hypothetical protein